MTLGRRTLPLNLRVPDLLREIRYALRSLRRSPGFAAAAVLTLALGIGANTAIFSLLEGVVLAPLPYAQPDRLAVVVLYNRALGYPTDLSFPDFLDWQRDAHSFDQIAAFTPWGYDLTGPGTPEHLSGQQISANFFSTLGVPVALGRNLSAAEDHYGAAPAAIISDRLWHARFGADPAAIGRSLTLSGVDYTVVGILPRGFRFGTRQADVYTPIGQVQRTDRTIHDIVCVARLGAHASLSQAQTEMNSVQAQIDRLNPATEKGLGIWIEPLKHFVVGDVSRVLMLLVGAVALVLLIACANVANLLLARSAARSREFTIRLALGAGRLQIVRQLITESVLLAIIGGALGIAVAKWGVRAVLAAASGSLPRAANIGIHAPVLLFALGVSVTVGILFGLAPAFATLRMVCTPAVGDTRMQRSLVVVQIALAMVLLAGAGLLLRTIRNLWNLNPGFDTAQVISFRVGLPPAMIATAPATRTAYRELTARIRQVPGVKAADITALVPLTPGADNAGPFWFGPHQPASMAEIPRALYFWTGPDYLRAMQIPLLRGRFFNSGDTPDSGRVVVIDTVLSRKYFPGRDPVGQNITVAHWGVARIVGVVGHVEHYALTGKAPGAEKPQIYASFYELPDPLVPMFRQDISIVARTANPAAVYRAAGNYPIYDMHTMRDLFSGAMSAERLAMLLLAAFAALALVLAWIGIYGVISYSMTRRVREVGIRMALGARNGDVLRMVIAQGARMAAIGIAAGAIAVLILIRAVSGFSSLLYGVPATDPLTLIAVALLLLSASVLACLIPARRAARLDPMAALRHE